MSDKKVAAIILAAGMGTRMKTRRPKVMHPLAGRPMINHLMDTVETLSPDEVVVVVGEGMDDVTEAVKPHPTVIQKERLGTGHAVLAARDVLRGFEGDILVLYGDTPLISAETLSKLVETRRKKLDPAVVVLGFYPEDPGNYGRLVYDREGGEIVGIVEAADATPIQAEIGLCNSGVMTFDGKRIWSLLTQIGNDNAKGEYYLTDAVGLAHKSGASCLLVEGDEGELLGVNSRAELALAEFHVQSQLRARAMAGGATLLDPSTAYFNWDTKLGRDVVVGPNVVFGPGVTVEDEVEIRAFCHFEGCAVKSGAIVGPFARLRPGADIGPDAHIGNFVEIKNATVEDGAKVNHLTYIGDARVGAKANVGAGTITCNYDGYFKSHTDIGAGAFIGSNTALVAPVKVGDGAYVGACSAISKDVPANALAVTRAQQLEFKGWGGRFRKKRAAEKEASKKGKG